MSNKEKDTRALRLDSVGIQEYQKNRYPYLFIDFAEEIRPGESARGYKNLTANDWFFEPHFSGDPNMPGMLQIEAMMQLGALMILTLPGNKGKTMYLATADRIKLTRKIVPGDRLDLEATLISWKRGLAACTAEGTVNGDLACRADYTLVLPDILNQYKK